MKKVAVIPGDGIGPEVIGATLKVLEKVAPGAFDFREVAMGGRRTFARRKPKDMSRF